MYYIALIIVALIFIWRIVAGFRKGMVQEIISLIAMVAARQAGGFMIQLMPGASEEVIGTLEERIGGISSVTSLLDEGMGPAQILENLLSGMDPEITDRMDARFFCGCTRQRVEKALVSIGKQELKDMIQEGKPIEMNCHFCNKRYEFSVEELRLLLEKAAR